MTPEGTLNGCLVLQSRSSKLPPIVPESSFVQLVQGSSNGRVGSLSHVSQEIYSPSRGKTAILQSAFPLNPEETLTIHNRWDSQSGLPLHISRHFLQVIQTSPYGMIWISAQNVEIHLLGVYNEKSSFLCWSNSSDLEYEVRSILPYDFFYHKFPPKSNLNLELSVGRVCSRWHRWSEYNRHPAERFQALEMSLFRNDSR